MSLLMQFEYLKNVECNWKHEFLSEYDYDL